MVVTLAVAGGFIGGVVSPCFAVRRFKKWLYSPWGTEYAIRKYEGSSDGGIK
jgi:hypothetical protein